MAKEPLCSYIFLKMFAQQNVSEVARIICYENDNRITFTFRDKQEVLLPLKWTNDIILIHDIEYMIQPIINHSYVSALVQTKKLTFTSGILTSIMVTKVH